MKLVFVFGLVALAGCVPTDPTGQLTAREQGVLAAGYTAGCRSADCERGSRAGAQVSSGDDVFVVQTWSGSGDAPPRGLFEDTKSRARIIIIDRRNQNSRVYNGYRQIKTDYGWCYSYKNSAGQEACL